jgi:hypothetical protein
MQSTLPHYANILRWMSAGLTLLPKEIWSRPVVLLRCNRKALRPCLHSHRFSQTDNGVLGDACWNLSESSHNRLQSVGCCRWWYSLNSYFAFTFWITLVFVGPRNLLPVTLLAPRILGWLLDFWKTCAPLLYHILECIWELNYAVKSANYKQTDV